MFNFTENEARAVKALYATCLNNMGGKTFKDLENDPFTWVGADDLVSAGWTKHEAAGTFSALADKLAIDEAEPREWALNMKAAKWASENI